MSNYLKHKNISLESECFSYNETKSRKAFKFEQNTTTENISAEEEARIIIEKAKCYSEKVRDYAHKKAEIEYEQAKTAGFKAGYEAGKDVVLQEHKKIIDQLKLLVKNIDEQKDNYVSYNEKNIYNLAFRIAEKVINQKLDKNEETFLNIYKKAVKDLVAKKWVKLTVSAYDYQFATANSDYLIDMVSGAETIDIEISDKALKGTCIVETSDKIVDASVDKQLSVLYNAVANS